METIIVGNAIHKNGRAFLHTFEENTREYVARMEAYQALEKAHRDLQATISEKKQGASDPSVFKEDETLLAEANSLLSSTKRLRTVDEYNQRRKRLLERLQTYKGTTGSSFVTRMEGNMKYEEMWNDDKKTGPFRGYLKDGTLVMRGRYVDGKRNGRLDEFYPNGKKKTVSNYVNDVRNGPYYELFEDGQLKKFQTYQNGKPEGYWNMYHENGQIKTEGMMEKGVPLFINEYYKNGSIKMRVLNGKMGKQRILFFGNKGDLQCMGCAKNGILNGNAILFYYDLYYAEVVFANGSLMIHDTKVDPSLYAFSSLRKQYEANQCLDTSLLPWRAIEKKEREIESLGKEVVCCYKGKDHCISLESYEECENGLDMVMDMDLRDRIRNSLYHMRIQAYEKCTWTLSGDLICVQTMEDAYAKVITQKQYYPCGIESSVGDERLRLRSESVDDGSAKRIVEYYNNGKKKMEKWQEGGKWKTVSYLNTGAKME